MGDYIPVRKDGSLGNNNNFIDLSNYITRTQADESYVNENGDGMRGTLDMANNAIKNVSEPKEPNDVATKLYVDSRIAQLKIVKGNTQPFTIHESGFVISELWKTKAGEWLSKSIFSMSDDKIVYPYKHKPLPESMYTGEFVIIYIPTTQAKNRLLKLSSDAERSLKN